jgi:hypothetical protein
MNNESTTADELQSGSTKEPLTPEVANPKEDNFWLGLAINIALMLALVGASLVAYHFYFVLPNKQKFAVIDIGEVLQLKELEVTAAATHADATDAERGEAFESIAKFAKQMEITIGDLQTECGCTLLVKAAVVKVAGADDLTPLLKQRMGIDQLDAAKLVQQIRGAGGRGQAPMLGGAR